MVVLYGVSGMTTVAVPCEAVRSFNMMGGKVLAELDDKYRGRVVCMGDFSPLADMGSDGMGLINGVVSEDPPSLETRNNFETLR